MCNRAASESPRSGQRRFLADLFADEGVSKDARGVELPNGNRDRRYVRGQNQMMRRVSREGPPHHPANRRAGKINGPRGKMPLGRNWPRKHCMFDR